MDTRMNTRMNTRGHARTLLDGSVGWLARLALVGSLWASLGYSTVITGDLTHADGSPWEGVVAIQSPAMTTAADVTITPSVVRRTVRAGLFTVALDLAPNVGSTPSGTSYTVSYVERITNNTWFETWVVPASGPVEVNDIRVTTSPVVNMTVLISQIDVSGGLDGQILKLASGALGWAADATGSGIDCSTSPELTVASGVLALTASTCNLVDTEADAASDTVTSITCTAGILAILRPANDARTVVFDSASLGWGADFSLDETEDSMFIYCPATDTPFIFGREG